MVAVDLGPVGHGDGDVGEGEDSSSTARREVSADLGVVHVERTVVFELDAGSVTFRLVGADGCALCHVDGTVLLRDDAALIEPRNRDVFEIQRAPFFHNDAGAALWHVGGNQAARAQGHIGLLVGTVTGNGVAREGKRCLLVRRKRERCVFAHLDDLAYHLLRLGVVEDPVAVQVDVDVLALFDGKDLIELPIAEEDVVYNPALCIG